MNDTTGIKREFFDSLKRGTGRAYIIARDNPEIDFTDYIIKGALKNYAYDGQCESSRAQYIYDLIAFSPQKEKIRRAVLNGLKNEKKDDHSLTHIFDLAKLYAQNGDKIMKKAIYNRFLRKIIFGCEWIGYDEILELDGMNGMIYIAEKFGKYLEEDPEKLEDDHIIHQFQNDNPDIDVWKELEKIANSNKFVKIYLDRVNDNNKSYEEYRKSNQNIKDLDYYVEDSTQKMIPWACRRNLSPEKVILLADKFLIEKDLRKKEKILSIFMHHKYPKDYKPILKLAKQTPKKDSSMQYFAIYALEYLQAPEIREFALEKLFHSRYPGYIANILVSNYCEGDAILLKSLAEKYKTDHIIENLASSFVKIYEANKTKECLEPLMEIYNKLNCSLHRNYILKILIENDILPEHVKEEMQYDCNLETRELYKSLVINK